MFKTYITYRAEFEDETIVILTFMKKIDMDVPIERPYLFDEEQSTGIIVVGCMDEEKNKYLLYFEEIDDIMYIYDGTEFKLITQLTEQLDPDEDYYDRYRFYGEELELAYDNYNGRSKELAEYITLEPNFRKFKNAAAEDD